MTVQLPAPWRPTPRLRRALLRRDFAAFTAKAFATVSPGEHYLPNWHIEHLALRLAAVRTERCRLILNLPPRSLKSILASVALPAWLLGHHPARRIICVSYSDELARHHSRCFRRVLESPWYQHTFPQTRIDPRKNTETELATTGQGFRLATSTGGTLTGRGGDLIVIDDPIKPADAESDSERRRVNEWFETTLFSRLDSKERGSILLAMQRLHEHDLAGHLLERGYEAVVLPAIATEAARYRTGEHIFHDRAAGEPLHPARESLATLQRIREESGSRVFEAQYQQNPVPAGGNLFKADWLRHYGISLARDAFEQIVQSWDTAAKTGSGNDYSVCTTWGIRNNLYFLLDLVRERLEYPDLLRAAIRQGELYRPHAVLVEDANAGTALIQSLEQETRLPVIGLRSKLDKVTRAAQVSAQLEAGRVHFPGEAPWLAELERELLAFPSGRHDDQVDSLVQFLLWAADNAPRPLEPMVDFSIPREDYPAWSPWSV